MARFAGDGVSFSQSEEEDMRKSLSSRRNTLMGSQLLERRGSIVRKEEEQDLTQEQIQAFQEAFAIFDKDGGGTIDAAELQKTLEECDIYVDGNDLVEILMTIDHDGNGEVDFEEFLNLMTNTNVFIQAVDGSPDAKNDHYRKRVILFDALTQFLRKQALKGANEIINYYSRKYKNITRNYNTGNSGAHVVGHYADVARLVGLTENELYAQLKELKLKQINPRDTSSPYAQTFHQGLLRSIEEERQKRKIIKPYGLGGPPPRRKQKAKPCPPKEPKRESQKLARSPSRVKLQIIGIDKLEHVAPERSTVCRPPSMTNFSKMANRRKSLNVVMLKNAFDLPKKHRPGWTGQRIQTINVDIVVEPGWSCVPLSLIDELKTVMREATDEYFTKTSVEKLASNLKFYRSLNTRKGPSFHLDQRVRDCMVSYSAATANNKVGRVGFASLDKVLKKDEHKIRVQKQKRERTTISRIKLTETLQRETLSIFNLLPNIAEK